MGCPHGENYELRGKWKCKSKCCIFYYIPIDKTKFIVSLPTLIFINTWIPIFPFLIIFRRLNELRYSRNNSPELKISVAVYRVIWYILLCLYYNTKKNRYPVLYEFNTKLLKPVLNITYVFHHIVRVFQN